MTLEPKSIPLSKYKDLFKDSFELVMRKPIAFMLLTAALLLLSAASEEVLFFEFLLAPILLIICGVGTLIAEAADLSKNPLELILNSNRKAWIGLSTLAAIIFMAGVVIFSMIYFLVLNYPVDKEVADSEPVTSSIKSVFFPLGARICSAMGLSIVLYTYSFLSAPCLMANLNLDLYYAIGLARRASDKNIPLGVVMFIIYLVVALVSSIIGAIVFLVVPFFMCFMYVVYRSVYLDKDGNEPTKKRVESTNFATA